MVASRFGWPGLSTLVVGAAGAAGAVDVLLDCVGILVCVCIATPAIPFVCVCIGVPAITLVCGLAAGGGSRGRVVVSSLFAFVIFVVLW